MPTYNLIVAMCRNNGIGSKGEIPWHIKQDLHFFAKMTKGNGQNAVVMGNTTWKSLHGQALKGRDNFVLSASASATASATASCNNTLETFKTITDLETYLSAHENKYETIWVIGGAQIYKQFLEADKINTCYVTYIDKAFECDTFFPVLDKTLWHETVQLDTFDDNYECGISFRMYKKKCIKCQNTGCH